MMAQKETSLFDLCSICYTETPKYRCPKCKTRTCSLGCYKRHQQRASCNGQRDPAAYLKKSQLATPAGIDRDYNYLKSVEREIDHASKDTIERGIGNRSATSKVFNRGVHPEGALQRYLIANRIHVTRAPTGMTRQRRNQTRSTKRGRIMWTVEWVNVDGSQTIQENSLESSTLSELYALMQLEKSNAAKRKLAAESSPNATHSFDHKRQRIQNVEHPDQAAKPMESSTKTPLPDSQASTVMDLTQYDSRPADRDPTAEAQLHTSSLKIDEDERDPAISMAPTNSDNIPTTGSHSKSDSDPVYFYLLKPGTASSSKVVVPVESDSTLTKALQDRVVLEYPTIYTLPHDPQSLPSGFMTEEQFLALRRSEDAELAGIVQKARADSGFPGSQTPSASTERPREIDPNHILDMLKRDITR